MLTKSENVHPRNENIGFIDRMIRFLIGAIALGFGFVYLSENVFLSNITENWLIYLTVISIYPLLTAILGMDPVYRLFNYRTGGDTGRNQRGSFPYQVKAAFGHAPKYCDSTNERSLASCHDEPVEQPRHATWKVDQDPMLYPGDDAMKEFSRHEKELKTDSEIKR